jgi:hypothetical protein
VSGKPGDDPTGAEWRRLAFGFGAMFVATIAFAAVFMWTLPFSRPVRLIIVGPLVLVVGWVWSWVGAAP